MPLMSTGYAFLTFETQHACTAALAYGALSNVLRNVVEDHQNSSKWRAANKMIDQYTTDLITDSAQEASEPTAIAWNNLLVGSAQRCCRSVLLNSVMLFIVIVVFSGSTILNLLTNVVGWLPSAIASVVTSLVPSLVVTLTSWILVPWLIQTFDNMTQMESHEMYAIWFIRKYYIYLVIAMIFVVSTTSTVVGIIDSVWDSGSATGTFDEVYKTDNSVLFIKYILNFTLITSPLELLQLTPVLLGTFSAMLDCFFRTCGCCKEYTDRIIGTGIPQVQLFQFGKQYVIVLHIVAIGLIFSAVAPMLAPFILFFLLIKRKVDHINMLLQPDVPIVTQDGQYFGMTNIAFAPLNLLVGTLGLFQLGMVAFFTLHEQYKIAVGTSVIFWLTTGLYFIALICNKLPLHKFKVDISSVSRSLTPIIGGEELGLVNKQGEKSKHDPLAYQHPALETYLNGSTLCDYLAAQDKGLSEDADQEGEAGEAKPAGKVDPRDNYGSMAGGTSVEMVLR